MKSPEKSHGKSGNWEVLEELFTMPAIPFMIFGETLGELFEF